MGGRADGYPSLGSKLQARSQHYSIRHIHLHELWALALPGDWHCMTAVQLGLSYTEFRLP